MAGNAFVTWAETTEPWLWEERALATLDLPLNLSGNSLASTLFRVEWNTRRGQGGGSNRAG